MVLAVSDFARRKGVSPRRVQAMIRDGVIQAELVGGRYLISESELTHEPKVARSMSPRMSWAFIRAVSGEDILVNSATERQRLATRVSRLRQSDRPAELLRSWLSSRAERRALRVDPADVSDLLLDHRVHRSGISDLRSGLSAAAEVEGYIGRADLDAVRREYLLIESDTPNVFFHVLDEDLPAPSDSLGVLLADLAEHRGPREDARIVELLRDLR